MHVELLEGDSREAWNECLRTTGCPVPFLSFDYHKACLANTPNATMHAFLMRKGGLFLYYPFLRFPLPASSGFDCETVYGYGGPWTNASGRDLTELYGPFLAWCRDIRMLTEFVRFTPLVENQRSAHPGLIVERNRTTLSMCLQQDLPAAISARARTAVRKAEKSGLQFSREDPSFHREFFQGYTGAMKRMNASLSYFFPEDYFRLLAFCEWPEVQFFSVRLASGEIAAAAMVLCAEADAYYHLGYSEPDGQRLGATSLLLCRIADCLRGQGVRRFFLGGGRTPAANDSLLFFKQSLASASHEFFIGKAVHDSEKYQEFVAEWLAHKGQPPSLLQFYR